MVCADVDEVAGSAVAKDVDGLFVRTDVSERGDVAAVFAEAHDAFGGIDIAFNNAGISPPDDNGILETEIATWVKVQQTNLTSVYVCCKEAIPRLRQRGGGVIINTASFVAVMGAATSQISYTASKAGVLALSRDLVCSSPAKASRVIALCPGRP